MSDEVLSTHELEQIKAAKTKFSALCKQELALQREFFLKRFILDLDSIGRYEEAEEVMDKFQTKSKGNIDINFVEAADLLQKVGKTRTATQQKAELQDVDVDSNGKTSMIEFLLLHFKVMILESYFRRKGVEPDVDLSTDGIGLAGVGTRLITEMYSPPVGLDPELEKMMKTFAIDKKEREMKIKGLEEIIAAGGVKAMATKAELEKLTASNESEVNHLEAKIKAATKKAEIAADKLLAAKNEEKLAKAAEDKAGSRGKLGEKSAAFGA